MKKFIILLGSLLLISCTEHDRNRMYQNAVEDYEVVDLFVERNIDNCKKSVSLQSWDTLVDAEKYCDCLLSYIAYSLDINDLRMVVAPTREVSHYEAEMIAETMQSASKSWIKQCTIESTK